jgi:hypothetical protein
MNNNAFEEGFEGVVGLDSSENKLAACLGRRLVAE